jgi:hypothetical protein
MNGTANGIVKKIPNLMASALLEPRGSKGRFFQHDLLLGKDEIGMNM